MREKTSETQHFRQKKIQQGYQTTDLLQQQKSNRRIFQTGERGGTYGFTQLGRVAEHLSYRLEN